MIAHSKPSFGEDECQAVLRVLRTGLLSSGPAVRQLEHSIARILGREAACVSSGTAALHMALQAMGVSIGQRVAIPTHVCPSVLYALQYVKAIPVVYDCGPNGFGSCPESVAKALKTAGAIIIVHQYGIPDPMILELNRDIPLLEDCAAAIGARIQGHAVGMLGKIAIFSFYATKLIAGGECGAISADADTVRWVREYRTPRYADDANMHFPYSPSDLSAALATVQLERLEQIIGRRTMLACRYAENLREVCRIPEAPNRSRPVWHRYVIETKKPRHELIQAAASAGIQIGFGVKTPIHRLLGLDSEAFPNSERAWQYSASLPLYPDLTPEDQDRIITFMRDFLRS